ncbi:uncharacterized protein B0I36DRAFT_370979 [Microdochium trichocladiopsis]|uniref:C2H2-type domain-containing protein n=1 Tax=Microdochium trichocladiopsis TaxID=1682393 RepID=A0A9P9BW29_9PEZI|nr:uncharacterized protein B0I36DRAFT_370979 [Microdochium trichocladiopsis]KAH7040185.1 hypothetical protein B0I36DRAFT_370979 [Microdochium trichocladiopsis]
MSIPSRSIPEDDVAPPPLPPPRFLPELNSQFEPRHQHTSSLDSRSSWDSPGHSPDQDRPRFERKNSDTATIRPVQKDEGYHSLNSTSSVGSQHSLPRLFMSHDRFQFNQPAQSQYDNTLLKKLDFRRGFDNASPPRRSGLIASSGSAPASRHGASERLRNQLPTLSLPSESGYTSVESSPYPREMPLRSGHSSRLMPFSGAMSNDYRSPIEPSDTESSPFSRSPIYRTKRNNSGSQQSDDIMTSTPNSAEHNTDEMDFAMDDTSSVRRLQSDEYQYSASANKRRALASPDDDTPMAMSEGGVSMDAVRRRLGTPRASPTPRLTVIPQGSISSVSSATGRSGSYTSTMSIAGTSMSSMPSQSGRLSPGHWSPSSGLSPVDVCHSPFNTASSLGPSPRVALARLSHQRQLSGSEGRSSASPRKVPDAAKGNASKLQGGYFMCECCPKKPKKFETADELQAHEAEKQYECSFCGNRFKNKNEAERHQNSLHVRRHSWSCSALLEHGYDHAFHESTNRPGEADVCGFCGDEFARSGSAGRVRQATEQDWEARLRHLQEVHKFRECNSSKKFFRADHFRQHLKHSHAGTSGKWTNMLENACMLNEEPPVPRR